MLTDGVVVLRPWRATDADWYAKAVGHAEIQRFTREPPELTAAEVQDAIVALADQPEVVGLCICDAATGQRLGNIALRHDATGGSLAYWVAASARGRGVATRALRLVSDWAVAALALPVLRLWTHADNLASRRVAERAGYQRARRPAAHRQGAGLGDGRLPSRRQRPGQRCFTGRALTRRRPRCWRGVGVRRR
jgi:RimJ/RimL family protein N-acetyltransferase